MCKRIIRSRIKLLFILCCLVLAGCNSPETNEDYIEDEIEYVE